jgi:trk system potassium uptake protein TrkA
MPQEKKKKKRFAIIGLGILGNSIARTLASEGAEVLVLDKNMKLIEAIKDEVSVAVQCDSTDRETLEQLGIADVDAAMVCIGEDFQSSVLTTANLIDLKVKRIAVRAINEMAASIFKRLGAHDIFFVESEMGVEIAHKLHRPSILQEMELGGGYRIIQWDPPTAFQGKSLLELALPKTFNVQVIAIKSAAEDSAVQIPTASSILQKGERLMVCGHEDDLHRLVTS